MTFVALDVNQVEIARSTKGNLNDAVKELSSNLLDGETLTVHQLKTNGEPGPQVTSIERGVNESN